MQCDERPYDLGQRGIVGAHLSVLGGGGLAAVFNRYTGDNPDFGFRGVWLMRKLVLWLTCLNHFMRRNLV